MIERPPKRLEMLLVEMLLPPSTAEEQHGLLANWPGYSSQKWFRFSVTIAYAFGTSLRDLNFYGNLSG